MNTCYSHGNMIVKYDGPLCPRCDDDRILQKLIQRERSRERLEQFGSDFKEAPAPSGTVAVEGEEDHE